MPRNDQAIRQLILLKQLESSRVGLTSDLRCHRRWVSWAQSVNVQIWGKVHESKRQDGD